MNPVRWPVWIALLHTPMIHGLLIFTSVFSAGRPLRANSLQRYITTAGRITTLQLATFYFRCSFSFSADVFCIDRYLRFEIRVRKGGGTLILKWIYLAQVRYLMDRGFIIYGKILDWGTVWFSRILPLSALAMTVLVCAYVRDDRFLQHCEPCFFFQVPTLSSWILKRLFSPKSLYLSAKTYSVLSWHQYRACLSFIYNSTKCCTILIV